MKIGIEATRAYMQKHQNKVLGLHLEGPYINIIKKGHMILNLFVNQVHR